MTTARGLFIVAALFTGVLCVAYWFVAREPAGTMLLGFMTAALTTVAVYMFFAQREADLFADRPNATMREAAGEHVGTYVTHSPAPFWIGIAIAAIVLGLVTAPAAAGLGLVALLFLICVLIVRSR
ncbi:MAG TPA: cytochrome c oxidase subunit 4 [Candidatus Elarobacter sp.]|nr:cytochrome c oxidase subunit 4 [Candidatus Elarobacter sp.]